MKAVIYLLIIISFLLASACTEDLETDYKGKSTNLLVVDGSISNDTTSHTITLSRTVDNEALASEPETGAIVTISDNVNIFNLTESEPGIYSTDSNVFGVIGTTYTLNISTKDGKTYEASSKLNPVSTIDSIRFVKEYFAFADMDFYKVYFYGQEPPELGQYYLWNIYLNDSLVNDTINKTRFEEDRYVNGVYMSDFDIYWLLEEDVRKDTTKVTLEMVSIPEEYYTYLIEIMTETTWRGSPWDATPANVSTNLSEGAVGFFTAKAITNKTIIYIKQEEE